MSDNITLVAEGGETITVKPEFKNLSQVVKDAIECAKENVPIPFDKISSSTICKIIDWTEHYEYEPPKVEEEGDKPVYPKSYINKDKIIISDYDKKFLDEAGLKTTLDLVIAANTMDFQSLYKVCIRYLALQIKGKKSTEIGELFKPIMKEFGYFNDKMEEASSSKQKTEEESK